MTKKRFIIIGDNNIEFLMQSKLLLPIYDNDKRLSLKSCCDLLNTQHEIIQQSKELIKKYYNENTDLIKENEQLKKEYREMEIKIGKLKGEIGELFCENQQLKSELAEIKRQEQEVIEYLQAYHKGDVNELKKELQE